MTKEAKYTEEIQNGKLERIKEKFGQFQAEISEVLHDTPRDLIINENTLKDLPCFREQPNANDVNFRWPQLEDIRTMKLQSPLKLKEIRAKGIAYSELTAIQLVFEGGVESPLFDGKYPDGIAIKSYPVPDKRIEKITGLHSNGYMRRFTLKFDDNQELTIFPESCDCSSYDCEIPPGHAIVGIYGRIELSRIARLGFIVMQEQLERRPT